MIRSLTLLACLATLLVSTAGHAADTKKVLMFTKSSAFEHSVVHRDKPDALGMAEQIVIDLGKANNFQVTATKDGNLITAENLAKYDAVLFFTQGDLTESGRDGQPPMAAEHKPAILEYVKNGGGFIGTHCGGADTFHGWDEFLSMVGGEFIGHGPQQESKVDVVDPTFPAMTGWPKSFSLVDEWYAYKGFNDRMHVLMMLRTEGMQGGNLYKRADYPITWCSEYGKGRVFYTGLGHREDVWENKLYQQMVANAILWSVGLKEGDATPNLKTLFGDESKALERINP